MNKYPFTKENTVKILDEKRRQFGRALSYAEKILFLHQGKGKEKKLNRGEDQIKLFPDRVAMQDATAQMACLQFIQAGRKKTHVPATIHCDHLLRAKEGAEVDLKNALETNYEVYEFLKSAAAKYGIEFWGPGSGIIHQVVLENYAIPGALMIGTDSHTPNAGGLGMVAIGVGGADAAEVMAGLAWETKNPYIVGVKLKGELTGWASAKDVILEMLRRLTVKGGTGKIIEYFGEGAESLSTTQKATITNMGAELGATTSLFVYDESMDAFLRNAGRIKDADWAKEQAQFLRPDDEVFSDPEKVYDQVLEIDLSSLKGSHAGPFTPDRITQIDDFNDLVKKEGWPEEAKAILIGSCTNSSYSDLYAAADILEQGKKNGLKPKIPFLLSPGSTQVYETIKRDGILQKLEAAGAIVLTNSCGPCIGQWDRTDIKLDESNVIFTTFNRNFVARNDGNPQTLAFVTSPELAAAISLSGKSGFNPYKDKLIGVNGQEFLLKPPKPPALPEGGLAQTKEGFIQPPEDSTALNIKINSTSDRLEILHRFKKWDGCDFVDLPILVKTKGKTTTDHISPGGKWLKYRGHLSNISENMLEGAVNAFTEKSGHGTNVLSGEKGVRFSDLAKIYKKEAKGCVIIGDENYGEGSSREHAAMSPRFLGIKVVAVRSFARIHEANLKKQGILPLTFSSAADYNLIEETDRVSFLNLNEIKMGKPVKGLFKRSDGSGYEILFNHTITEEQLKWFKAGSALNTLN
ncbi:aconitate hydratase [Candidatus Auribacterota bacterium]